MCGIAGVVSRNPIDARDVRRMNDLLQHRGPDGEGYFATAGCDLPGDLKGAIAFRPHSASHVVLAHRRLAIVDLSPAGHQPMVLSSRYVITYNGEVYNHFELRQDLESLGYHFSSGSDTEVILAAYDAWGPKCLERFNGMWAFVIFDSLKQRVFIARDRFGKKPFYYARSASSYVFASEIKAVVAHPDIRTEPNLERCQSYLDRGASVQGVETEFVGVNRFPAASYIECSVEDLLAGDAMPERYWSVQANCSDEPFDESTARQLAARYYELLEDAVRLRLRADVKVGSALSGGLDSSSIVFLVNKLLKEQGSEDKQETFSCVYKTPGTEACDESAYIDTLAEALAVRSNQIEPREHDIPAEHARVIYAMDCPPDSTCMSGWHTFKRVAESDVTVTLDGQGADEQLAGYLGYYVYWFAGASLRTIANDFLPASRVPRASKLIWRGLILNLAGRVIGRNGVRAALRRQGRREDPFRSLNEVLLADTESNLHTLIHYSDRVSMAHSIESRMPFMDYRLVEFLASVPAVYKLHDGWTKYLARLAFDGKLPDAIVWRRDKMGWPIPEAHWFNGGLREWMANIISGSIFLRRLGRDSAVEAATRPDAPIAQRVRLLNLAVWHRRFFPAASEEKTRA